MNDTDAALDCGCRSQCDQINYETSVITSVFPAHLYLDELQKHNENVTEEYLRYINDLLTFLPRSMLTRTSVVCTSSIVDQY